MNTPVSRRALVRGAVLIPVGLALSAAGCANLSQFASDASTIANGLAGILPTIEGVVGVGTSVAATVNDIVARIQAGATALAGAAGPGAQTIVQQIGAGISALSTALTGFTLPSWVSTVISAAGALLPVVQGAVGLLIAARQAPSGMTADQARSILLAAAK